MPSAPAHVSTMIASPTEYFPGPPFDPEPWLTSLKSKDTVRPVVEVSSCVTVAGLDTGGEKSRNTFVPMTAAKEKDSAASAIRMWPLPDSRRVRYASDAHRTR